jgi:hypothetical protein
LNKEPSRRFGCKNDFDDLKKHPWFNDINWDNLYNKKLDTPFKPKVAGENWQDNFDEEFIKEGKIRNYTIITYHRSYQLLRSNEYGLD